MNGQIKASQLPDYQGAALLIDVRSPSEYAKGYIPGAINVPLFDDDQRAEIGTLYVRASRDAAVERGLEIVGPRMAPIVRQVRELCAGKKVILYCWRGGMRSGAMQWLLETAGIPTLRITGGYKAYRKLFDMLLSKKWNFVTLAGPTGCGKTEILQNIQSLGCQMIDLEGIAHHKGSAFGHLGQQTQPTTEHFINLLYEQMHTADPALPTWVEGESVLIGHVFIPPALYNQLNEAPIVHYNLVRKIRIERIMSEYGSFSPEDLKLSFTKISKRLGNDNYKFAVEALDSGDIRKAIEIALVYYDKSYNKSIEKRTAIQHIYIECDSPDMRANALKIIELWK